MGEALHIQWFLLLAMLAQVTVSLCVDPSPIDVSASIITSEAVAYVLITIV